MNLIKQFKPLVKGNARKLASASGVDKRDLEQEGYLVLLEMQDNDFGDNKNAVKSYLKLRVIGAMKNYIAKNAGPTAVPSNAFWDHGERAKRGAFEEIGDSINSDDPETLYLKNERQMIFNEKVIAFLESLSVREGIVFAERIAAEEPMNCRELAEFIGVSSPQTVLNIEKRVLNKAKETF